MRKLWQGITMCVFFSSIQAIAQMDRQARCDALVKADMSATAEKSPAVYKTVKGYTYEYSRSRNSCVIIVQYRTHDKSHGSMIQILAVNAVTMQPMEGYKNIFLRKPNDVDGIEEAVNVLFEKYSK